MIPCFCDAPEAWQTGIQDPATPMLEGMVFFHNELLFYIVVIGIGVCVLLFLILFNFNDSKNDKVAKFTHASLLEIIWTIIPAVILFFISVPSFTLLYSLDELIDPELTLKIIGHQWYWSYEYSDFANSIINFDSYMVGTADLQFSDFRLLEVDNRVVLPTETHIRLLITSADVLHAWAVPSFGIKVDACPGRLSQASLFIKREGYFYGQCSEICGVNHGFMPIVVRAISPVDFLVWVEAKIQ